MKKVIRLTESDLIKIVKRIIKESDHMDLVDRGSRDHLRSKGWSMRGKDEDQDYVTFEGKKYYSDDIEYADYHDLGELPRVENGKLIVTNPIWEY